MLTGTAERQLEARRAAAAFLPGARLTVDLRELPEGRFPAIWGEVKEALEQTARDCSPDIVLAPGARTRTRTTGRSRRSCRPCSAISCTWPMRSRNGTAI